jgi:16S rRNA (cytidine1402-2'-O)-methyltransferase
MSTLYLMPNLLGEGAIEWSLPQNVINIARQVKHWFVEDEKAARRFLKLCGVMPPFEGIRMYLIDKHSPLSLGRGVGGEILKQIGESDAAVLSEAGCPVIADPGNNIVRAWRSKGGIVKPLTGPSSILLALMASGFNGQSFTFHGYLPIQSEARMKKIRELEAAASKTGYTQLFIETPFRNESLFSDLLKSCKENTLLSIAMDLTLASEEIKTYRISEWKKQKIELKNRPAVFSIFV